MIHDDATLAQVNAANPTRSTWLSANAGSGKTRVLTDRVARMLLDGVPPQRILCLTYTRAAASEMQNRLFERLGDWAMMEDGALRDSLSELGVATEPMGPTVLPKARRLFAQAIETPGGLKIQTIHSFCASLLRRFPLEARVSPSFTEMDDRAAKLLRIEILDALALEEPDAMQVFARYFTGEDADAMLAEISRNRQFFEQTPTEADLRQLFDLAADVSPASILSQVFDGSEADTIATALVALRQGSSTDVEFAAKLSLLDLSTPGLDLMTSLEGLLLTKSGKNPFSPGTRNPTKGTREAMPDGGAAYTALQERLADARPARVALAAVEKTKALHRFASAFLPRLERRKEAAGWLDFDDLIHKARTLLSDPGVAAWVLFRLDGGIDHVLVDEAQDTSPAQWHVIRLLTEEFTSGESARLDTPRTLFVVGDQKQSIYSFQGADPAAFDEMRTHYHKALASVGQELHQEELLYSFRSAKPVLTLVDHAFQGAPGAGMGDHIEHRAFKQDLPGRVDLWNWIDGAKDKHELDWFDPVDTVGSSHHAVQLSERIAGFIADRLDHGQITQIGRDGPVTRRITPKDFLILVQRRSTLFHEIIRACKTRGLPLAGADRLRIGGELGVKDLTALLAYLATPEDDLSLATVLRSPLGGLSEPELHQIAYGRKTVLRAAFEQAKDRFPEVHAMLTDLRSAADFLRPYDLLERCLTRHKGREKLLARLGKEAEEGIAALLDQAQNFERTAIPGLTSFLTWLEADDVTIKRQIGSDADEIRVMTVHGAKGLEAPIVILPDTAKTAERTRKDILQMGDTAIWRMKEDRQTPLQANVTDALKTKAAQERQRLLYVAMTRAESWLVICGSGEATKPEAVAWYEYAKKGLEEAGASAPQHPDIALRLEHGVWPDDLRKPPDGNAATPVILPDWANTQSTQTATDEKPLAPSKFDGAKALPGPENLLDEGAAMLRGTMIHRLLEHLPATPRDQWQTLSATLLGDYVPPRDEDLFEIARRVLETPELGFLFAPETLAEVPISAFLPELNGRRMLGTLDRVALGPNEVFAVDFKSNAVVPQSAEAIPLGILQQMGAYLSALEQIYPKAEITIAILWTETAELMTVPHDIVRTALRSAHIS